MLRTIPPAKKFGAGGAGGDGRTVPIPSVPPDRGRIGGVVNNGGIAICRIRPGGWPYWCPRVWRWGCELDLSWTGDFVWSVVAKKGSFSMVMHLSTSPSVVARLRALLFSGFRWKTAAGGEICSDGCKQFCSMCKPANLSLSGAAETVTSIALFVFNFVVNFLISNQQHDFMASNPVEAPLDLLSPPRSLLI